MDRGSLDFTWFGQLTSQGVFFVTRPKHNTAHAVVEASPVVERSLIVADEVISLTAAQAQPHCPALRHRIEVVVPQSGELLTLLTSHLTFASITVAAIYKDRWQIAPLIPRCLELPRFRGHLTAWAGKPGRERSSRCQRVDQAYPPE